MTFAYFIMNFNEMEIAYEISNCRKPSVAISIAKVIGATSKKDGYYEGNGYKVSWCVGHLVQNGKSR